MDSLYQWYKQFFNQLKKIIPKLFLDFGSCVNSVKYLIIATHVLFLKEVAGVGPRASPTQVNSEGDVETGNLILSISDRLVSAMVEPGQNQTKKTLTTPTVGRFVLLYLQWISVFHV